MVKSEIENDICKFFVDILYFLNESKAWRPDRPIEAWK
jgi:hypothetical protein